MRKNVSLVRKTHCIMRKFQQLRWPNTVLARAFAYAIQRAHKYCKNKHAVNKAINLLNTRLNCAIFLYN